MALEEIQEARLVNTRNREVTNLVKMAFAFSGFGALATGAAPIMITLALTSLYFTDEFNTASAITTMSLFQSISNSLRELPILLALLGEATICS